MNFDYSSVTKEIPYILIYFPRQLFFFGSWSAASIQGRKLFKGGNCCFFDLEKIQIVAKNFVVLVNKLNFCCRNYSRELFKRGNY